MKTLKDLTPEIRSKIQSYKDHCTVDLYSGVEYDNYDRNTIVEYIDKLYSIVNREKPVIIVAKDPKEYKKMFNQISSESYDSLIIDTVKKKNNEENFDDSIVENTMLLDKKDYPNTKSDSHFLVLCSSYHRVYLTWYKFIQDEFGINHSNVDILNWLYERANNNILRGYFTEKYVLVLRMPKRIDRNSFGFHNTKEGAIRWEDYSMYYVNGRKMPKDIFLKVVNNKYTFEEFIKLKNEDTKAGVVTMIKENEGDLALMDFLGAEVVDQQTINHSSGYSEIVKLWKTKKSFPFLSDINGNENQPYCWLELKCPSTGSIYLIDSSAHFTNAIEACKFHRPSSIPNDLKYDFINFNN